MPRTAQHAQTLSHARHAMCRTLSTTVFASAVASLTTTRTASYVVQEPSISMVPRARTALLIAMHAPLLPANALFAPLLSKSNQMALALVLLDTT